MPDASQPQAVVQDAEWVNDVDDLPVPPYELIYLVVGPSTARDFVKAGKEIANQCLVDALRKKGLAMSRFRAILDFGCGCGRMIRHWRPLTNTRLYGTDCNPKLVEWCRANLPFAEFLIRHWRPLTNTRLYGTDYNTKLVEWCRANLPFAEFQVNQLEPPLNYLDRQFDFIFAGSVFTHFPEQLQFRWLEELRRILMPGGYLLMTTRGDHYAPELPSELRRRYDDGEFVAVNEGEAGTNLCGAYHSKAYVQRCLAKDFDLADFIPKGWDTQDIVLLRKPVKQS